MSSIKDKELERISQEAIWGAAAIAKLLNMSEKRVYTLARQGKLPIKRVGGQLFTTKARLQRFMDEGFD